MARETRPKDYPKLKNYQPSKFMLPTSHYDKETADRAVKFIENLCHTKGKWAGKRFWLLPWQEQLIRDIFGIVKADGYRQFRTAFVEICKKVGKSELAAAITHAYGGYSNRGCEIEPVRGEYPFFMSIGSGSLRLSSSSVGISAYDRTLSYTTYGANYKWIFLIDATKDMVYYFSVDSTTSITIRGYRANINTVSLFDTPSTGRTLLFEKTIVFSTAISQQYFSYNYDEESEKLFIMSGANANISNGGAFTITEIDVANDYAVKQYSMTNKTGVTLRMFYSRDNALCYDGYIYLMPYSGTYNIFREEIGNSANVQKIDTAVRQCWPTWAKDKRLYFAYPSSYTPSWGLYVVETDSFTMKYPEAKYLYDSSFRQFVPVKGVPMMYFMANGSSDGVFGIRTDYLATINNLDSPVVKTADKTMKVTYTLSEVTE